MGIFWKSTSSWICPNIPTIWRWQNQLCVFLLQFLSHGKKCLNVSSRNRVEEKVRLQHTQPTNCTMQKQQPGAMCTLHNNAWYTCTWLHCAKCTVCIVHCPITIKCGVKTLTIWSASQRLFSTFPSPPPLKRQTRCTLVQQDVLFAPHSFSLAYLYRGLQEIGEGSIFSQVVLLVNTQLWGAEGLG